MTGTYVSIRDTCTIYGASAVAVAAIPGLVVVLGETFVIFSVVRLNLQNFRAASLAVVFIEYMYDNLGGRHLMTLSLLFSTSIIFWLALLLVGLLFG